MTEPANGIVIGGGISGLACAFRLHQLGVPVTLLEETDRVGGLIETVSRNDFLFESGPQSFSGTDFLLDLVRELGIEGDLCESNPRTPRFVLRRGRLQKLPMSPQAILTSSLLAPGARLKLVSEALRHSKSPAEDESVAQFVKRKFGNEILEYLVAPFVSGVYAGDPEKLSLRAAFPSLQEWEQKYGSVVRGAMKSRPPKAERKGPPPLCSFHPGMRTLTQGLAAKLGPSLQPDTRVCAVSRSDSGRRPVYQIDCVRDDGPEKLSAGIVVIATPAYAASHLVASLSQDLAKTLSGIDYAGVVVAATGYYKRQVSGPLDGFGVLVPRAEKLHTLGIVWNSSLFPDRAPEGQMVLTSFLGGATDPEMVSKPDETIAAVVHDENARILGLTGPPIDTVVWKHPKALPQYNLGHGHNVRAIRESEKAIPGLYFAGNYLEGPSIGKCVEQGFQTAEAARNYLQQAAAR